MSILVSWCILEFRFFLGGGYCICKIVMRCKSKIMLYVLEDKKNPWKQTPVSQELPSHDLDQVNFHIHVMYLLILHTELSLHLFQIQAGMQTILHRTFSSAISHTAARHPVFLDMYLQSASQNVKVLGLNVLLKGKIAAVVMRGGMVLHQPQVWPADLICLNTIRMQAYSAAYVVYTCAHGRRLWRGSRRASRTYAKELCWASQTCKCDFWSKLATPFTPARPLPVKGY